MTNPHAATGGKSAESLENALVRGPLEFRTLERAITAKDFEYIARTTVGLVSRAKALTQVDVWRHAMPGTVEVLLLPHVEATSPEDGITLEQLQSQQTKVALQQVQQALNERSPLGIHCIVKWAQCKKITVRAVIALKKGQDEASVKQKVQTRFAASYQPTYLGLWTATA